MRDWTLGLFLEVGSSHFEKLGVVLGLEEIEFEAKGRDLMMGLLCFLTGFCRVLVNKGEEK